MSSPRRNTAAPAATGRDGETSKNGSGILADEQQRLKVAVKLAEAAARLDVCPKTAETMLARGGVTPIHLPTRGEGERQHVVYSVQELAAWTAHGCPSARTWRPLWKRVRDERGGGM